MTKQKPAVATRTVEVPGAKLNVEVRGAGSVLLCLGARGATPRAGPHARRARGAHQRAAARFGAVARRAIVSAAGETSGEQMARRAAVALAERLGIPVTYQPGGHGGWGSDPEQFADRLDEALQGT